MRLMVDSTVNANFSLVVDVGRWKGAEKLIRFCE